MLLIPVAVLAAAAGVWKVLDVAYTALQPNRCSWCGLSIASHTGQEPC